MRDLGEVEYILRIKIYRDRSKRIIIHSQQVYLNKILAKFNMENSNKGFIPTQHSLSLTKTQCLLDTKEVEQISKIPYASTIGSIIYAMICTRPNTALAFCMCSKYQANPREVHWTSAKQTNTILDRNRVSALV